MFKKILVGTFVVGLIGILVVGALNRTNAQAGDQVRGQGWGNGNTVTEHTATGGGQGRGQGGPGWGQQDAAGAQLEAGQALAQETVRGTVVSVDQNVLVVKTAAGAQVTVENRPWLFALESAFTAQVGDQVTLSGYDQNGVFEVARIDNASNGKSVVLRDESGRPGWSGRGRRAGG